MDDINWLDIGITILVISLGSSLGITTAVLVVKALGIL